MLSILLHHIRFLSNNQFCVVNEHESRGSSHCIRYINFVIDTSSRAYFIDNLMLIKDWIGTIPLKLLVSFLWEGGITNMEKSRGFIDFILPPSCKLKTKNFRAIVPIQFLIYIKFSLKWALDEVSTSKLMYLIQWEIDLASTSFTTHNWVLLKNLMWWT